MKTLIEIEAAISQLPEQDVEELSRWLSQRQNNRGGDVETWLKGARGAAKPGVTTDGVLAVTRGET